MKIQLTTKSTYSKKHNVQKLLKRINTKTKQNDITSNKTNFFKAVPEKLKYTFF